MRRLIMIVNTLFGVVLVSAQTWANHHIEGIWENARTQISVQVEQVSNGIRVQRLDKNGWHTYREFREDQYRDQHGNTYILYGDRLEWESNNGRKRLSFRKTSSRHPDRYDYRSERGSKDTYIERNHYRQGSHDVDRNRLDGKWINASTGQSIHIKHRRRGIKVRAHRGGWTTFHRQSRDTYRDHRGNEYRIARRGITYTSWNGDFMMRFRRY